MEKTKYYYNTKFPARVIEEAYNVYTSKLQFKEGVDSLLLTQLKQPTTLRMDYGLEIWNLDSLQEFLEELPKVNSANIRHNQSHHAYGHFQLFVCTAFTEVSVCLAETADIKSVFQVFENNIESSKITVESHPIKIFIGHGHSNQWRDLKSHLQDQHGFEVEAYEIGPRAGLSIKEVIESMLNESSIAFLVLTGEDETTDGKFHARDNVLHEVGLFQGRLGFRRAVVLLEEDVYEFSNILGVNQIRFKKGAIRETFGDVVATIRRELVDGG